MRYLLLCCFLLTGLHLMGQDTTANPFDLYPASDQGVSSVTDVPGEMVNGEADLIFIHLLLLVIAACLWVMFRDLIGQCFAAVLNDSVMVQLYRRRSGGKMVALTLCYFLFFLAAGFFLYLVAGYYGYQFGFGPWGDWGLVSAVVAALTGLKLLVLRLLGRIYPLGEELSRYTFALMVFSILAGFFLLPVNLLVSYAPEPWRPYFLLSGVVALMVVYLLQLLRGLVIANRYVGRRPLHFLLYLCTIEIAPVLLIYRYLSTTV